MFSGGDYEEVSRWLRNFVVSHAKRENSRVEAVIETDGAREGTSYGVRLRLGDAVVPPPDRDPIELGYDDVASGRGRLAWCDARAGQMRALARELSDAVSGSTRSALVR